MPPVCSNSVRRSASSFTPNRSAMPGRYQTGSTAALVTATSPVSFMIVPSTLSRPAATASSSSEMVSRALVIAMLGRMSAPSPISVRKSSAMRWPHGSSETMRPGSDHCGNGPTSTTGAVLVRSGRAIGLSEPEETASAR